MCNLIKMIAIIFIILLIKMCKSCLKILFRIFTYFYTANGKKNDSYLFREIFSLIYGAMLAQHGTAHRFVLKVTQPL